MTRRADGGLGPENTLRFSGNTTRAWRENAVCCFEAARRNHGVPWRKRDFFKSLTADLHVEVNTMCEANAYLLKDGKEELVMESLDTVEPDNGTLRLTNIFGEQKFIKGKIARLALVDHKVFIEKAEE